MRFTEWEKRAFDFTDYSKSRINDLACFYGGKVLGYLVHNSYTHEDACKKLAAIVYYLCKADSFFSGERELWEALFGFNLSVYDAMDWFNSFGGKYAIEDWIDYMPRSDKDNFLYLACCVFAANGSIYDEEKAILRRFE